MNDNIELNKLLVEVSKQIVEHRSNGIIPEFDEEGFMAATIIFFAGITHGVYELSKSEGIPDNVAEAMSLDSLNKLYDYIKIYTGINLKDE